MRERRTMLLFAMVTVAVTTAACRARPQPPSVTPFSAQVLSLGPSGATIRTVLLVRNPNRYAITTRSVHARVIVATQDLGAVDPPVVMVLAPHVDTWVTVDLPVPWGSLPVLAMAMMVSPSLPYHVDGTVTVDVHGLPLETGFTLDGTIPRTLLMR